MYGQMTAGSWIYIGTQGILQGTYETLAARGAAPFRRQSHRSDGRHGRTRRHGRRPTAGRHDERRRSARRRSGSVPHCAARRDRLSGRVGTARSMRRSIALRRAARESTRRGRSASRATPPTCCRRSSRAAFTPDVVTDQTSAHDALNGYVPNGLSLQAALALRGRDPDDYVARSVAGDGTARRGDAGVAAPRQRRLRLRQQHPGARPLRPASPMRSTSRGSCPSTSGRCSAKARGRSAGRRSPAIRTTSPPPTRCARDVSGRRGAGAVDPAGARRGSQFQGLPARICWLGYGARARFGLKINDMVRRGEISAPIVIGRDHLDTGSVASPQSRDGSHARRQRRHRRLADSQRAAQHGVRRHLGVGASRRRRRHRPLAARRHGGRRRRHAPTPTSGWSGC